MSIERTEKEYKSPGTQEYRDTEHYETLESTVPVSGSYSCEGLVWKAGRGLGSGDRWDPMSEPATTIGVKRCSFISISFPPLDLFGSILVLEWGPET